jgi:peptidoglycan biosynthesis protein MviN/MurJ (putative lipid II flippase)
VSNRVGRTEQVRVARLAAISALAKGPGFLLPIVIAAFFGAGRTTDEYFLAYAALLFVGGSTGQALEAAIVPFAADALHERTTHAQERIGRFARRAVTAGLVAAVVGIVALWFGMSASAAMHESRRAASLHYALLTPAIIGWAVSGVYTGALVAALQFERSAVANAFRGLGALAGAALAGITHNLYFLPVGLSCGEVVRVIWLRTSWRRAAATDLGPLGDSTHAAPLGDFRRAATAQIAAQGLLAATPLIERLAAGAMMVAAISRLEYAYRLLMVCAVLFDGGVAPWLLARWSRMRSIGRFDARWHEVARSIGFATVISATIGTLLASLAPLLVRALFLHGRFTIADASVVTSLIRWYSVGFVANMIVLCAERALLATARNRRLLELGIVRASVRIAIVFLFAGSVGLRVFPLAFALSEITYLASVLLQFRVERHASREAEAQGAATGSVST